SRYRVGCPSTKIACGQSLYAVRSGIAEWTPKRRAAYDAADTTPRSFGLPPTTTGLPFSEGSYSSSTDTKNASMSTWKYVRTLQGTAPNFAAKVRAPAGFSSRLCD